MLLRWFDRNSDIRETHAGRAASLWGDGLEDQSIAGLAYPATWKTISEDELLIYRIDLAREVIDPASSASPQCLMRDAACARTYRTVNTYGALSDAPYADAVRQQIGHALEAGGMARQQDFGYAIDRGRQIFSDWFAPKSAVAGVSLPVDSPEFQLELLVLRTMSIACAKQRASDFNEERRSAGDSLAHALLVSLHSGMNAAYLYPQHALQHQLLSLACWLGWLHRGRPCLMPPFIAEYLLDVLDSATARPDVETALLKHYAAEIGGQNGLVRAAKRSLAGQAFPVIKPSRLRWRSRAAKLSILIEEFVRAETRAEYNDVWMPGTSTTSVPQDDPLLSLESDSLGRCGDGLSIARATTARK